MKPIHKLYGEKLERRRQENINRLMAMFKSCRRSRVLVDMPADQLLLLIQLLHRNKDTFADLLGNIHGIHDLIRDLSSQDVKDAQNQLMVLSVHDS